MSAPLVINLKDGSVWERRAVTGEGVALYALAGSCKCPEFVMATESELAALGIAGSADVLPVPVGREPQGVDVEDQREQAEAWEGHILGAWDGKFAMESGLDRAVLKLARMVKADVSELAALRTRVAELLAERHTTNEALSDAAEALRANQCPCPPASRPHQVGCPLDGVPGSGSERPVNGLTSVYMPVASLREDPHDSPLHHPYRVSHDLPEGGAR